MASKASPAYIGSDGREKLFTMQRGTLVALENFVTLEKRVYVMSRNAPHRHHYVPQMVQRNFANESGGLFFWRRGLPVGQVRVSKPSNLFVEEHLYTLVDENGVRDPSIEYWFGRLESAVAPFIQEFLTKVRAGVTPIIHRAHLDLWHTYVYHAQKRTVAWHQRFLTPEDLLVVMKEIATEQQWYEHIHRWEEDREDALREMNNARIASQVTPMPDEMLEEFRSMGLTVYIAPARTSFILGDDMRGEAILGARWIQFMPIAPDVAVGYCDAPGVHMERVTAIDVRRMNEAMTKQSYLIAGRSEAQIASLSRTPYAPPEILKDWFDHRRMLEQ